ncbi:MAG: cell division protein FtsA [Oscillospiraceae bacterium]
MPRTSNRSVKSNTSSKPSEANMIEGAEAVKEAAPAPEKKKRGRKPASSKETAAAAKKGKTAKTTRSKPAAKSVKKRSQGEDEIFALDIGTRNVVGILGKMENGVFSVISSYTTAHKQRAMIDGQIEDIQEVARVVKLVKDKLEEKTGVSLSRVAIAAAGRALKTQHTELEIDIEEKDVITEDAVKSFEVETVFKAQNELDEQVKDGNLVFYCVGHTVVNYFLDDYKIKSLIGHKGKKVKIELIAAFLPSIVVESLYSVMDLNELEVASLTLEPIAAMNVIIPPEVRLINIALVDIGAGTSDIAISKNGSIVAYAMSTVAGDEITEEIIRNYIVDFETAEQMKLCSKEEISYKDILGFEHTVTAQEFYSSLYPAVDSLAANISENIVKANGQAPAAVFLVGGGSLIPDLAKTVAEKLEIPENRVAVGGKNAFKNISLGRSGLNGPEYVTPIGIGITAVVNKGYDFSVITLNGKKMRIFDTRAVTVVDLLMLAGFKTNQIIGRSGRNLTFTLNGEKQLLKGEFAVPGEITLNGMPAALDNTVKQGDVIEFTPAVSGMNASVNISDIAGDVSGKKVFVDGTEYLIGITAQANGKTVNGDYQIQNFDAITVSEVDTLGDLMDIMPFDTDSVSFYKGGRLLSFDYILREGDDIITGDKVVNPEAKEGRLAKAAAEKMEIKTDYTIPQQETAPKQPDVHTEETADTESTAEFRVVLNGKSVVLEPRPNNAPHEFIELMAVADIDIDNPPPSGDMITTINGKAASFMDTVNYGDSIVIKWADK